jgi:pSer/pThr/pTyr-binding forkhead associated (FHA) protein
MKPTSVTICVIDGLLRERRYTFTTPTTCIVGRAPDCEICIPSDVANRDISRHHCLLEINPPEILLWDLASTNGTYVNGDKISTRGREADPADTEPNEHRSPRIDLHDGDEIRLGDIIMLINIAHEEEPVEMQPLCFPPVL